MLFDSRKVLANPLETSFAIEIVVSIKDNFPKPIIDFWGEVVVSDTLEWFKKAQAKAIELDADFVSIYFNIEEPVETDCKAVFEKYQVLLEKIQEISKVPLMIRGTGIKTFDALFLPKLIEVLSKPVVIAFAQDVNYKPIIGAILKSPLKLDLKLVLRTPIDINLTKELNVLAIDEGLSAEQILIDTDTGCVGMGLDYGYSIIERLCVARKDGDKLLDMPIIVFAGEETYKAKEAKSLDFKDAWGNLEQRAISYEIATATALIVAGANFVVTWNPTTVAILKSLQKKEHCKC